MEWTAAGVAGAWRFNQRLWRLLSEAMPALPPAGSPVPAEISPAAMALRQTTHRTIAAVTDDIERFHFNRAVARIYEFANALDAFKPTTGDGPVLREALETLVKVTGPMMPHLAEEMWQALGHHQLLADTAWPVSDPALTREDTVTIAIQVSGKLRATLDLARDLDQGTLESTALANENVQRAIGGRPVRKVIVVPNRIVNVVV